MLYPTYIVKYTSPQHFDQTLLSRKINAMRPATLTQNLEHLRWNYRLLQKRTPNSDIMAVVKANAYGHGMLQVSQTLVQVGCKQFAVTDAAEGKYLRQHLNKDMGIILLSGIYDIDDANLCILHQLTPVITTTQQIKLLHQTGFQGNVWLKVDTGMSRLGTEHLQKHIQSIKQSSFKLIGIMSHLACADNPNHPLNQQQLQRFSVIQDTTDAPAYSLYNSAGIIAFSDKLATEVTRPGLALYGIEPIPDQPLGLKPVAELSSQIIQIRSIKKGESVSYGATWFAPQDMCIAIVALGYADGLPRLLSNQGEADVNGHLLPIVGRVCMDYCMLAIDENQVSIGDKVIFFGAGDNQPKANQVAAKCQTIAYEIFTNLSNRLNNIYLGEKTDE